MSRLRTISRRAFLISSVAIAGGVGFGYWKYKQPYGNPLDQGLANGEAALTPYVLINQDGVSIIVPRAEMGQGVHTTLAALVAEELDIDLAKVNILHGPASQAYYNAAVIEEGLPFAVTDTSKLANSARDFIDVPAKLFGMQITGGSSSVADAYEKMRVAGAAAKEVLLKAAALKLGVNETLLKTNNAGIEPSADPKLKPQSQWKILGKSQDRVDVASKSTGTAKFGLDIELPNMLFASIRVNPRLGSAMMSYDISAAKDMPGVKKFVEVDNGVAVIASNTWYAFKAVNAIQFDWAEANYPMDTLAHLQAVRDSFVDAQQDSQFRDDGNVEAELANADKVISAEYKVPYLAHAPLEPMNATAWLRDGELDVWAGTQIPTQALKEAANITGLDESKIHIHTTLMGGSFGRRLEMDYIIQAIKIAAQTEGDPVKLTWTREEDTTHDNYRPIGMARFKAAVNKDAKLAVDLQLSGGSVNTSQMGRLGLPLIGPDIAIVQAAWDQPYGIEHYRVTGYRPDNDFPISSWRSVGASQNGFFHESMMDEIAHARRLDPMQMRIQLMTHGPSKKVLETVAQMSDWSSPLPEGHGRGVAFCLSFGVPSAQVIEVSVIDAKIKILKAFAAVDVGIAIDPRNIKAQVSGGLIFGLSAAMMGEITLKDGMVEQTNFHQFNSLRINQSPDIQVKVLENGSRIKGIGEPGVPPAAPALANAIFAATGERIRELPLNKSISFI